MDIGNKIKKYRESMGFSQEELADKIYVSRQTLSNWETNKFYPDIKSITMLCNMFDVSLDEFIKGDIEEMKRKIEEDEIKGFMTLSWIFTIEMLVMILSAYPLMMVGIIGIVIWLLIVIITMISAFKLEKLKKHYNIQTYKEIIAFYEGKNLSHDEKNIELGKRKYQKILLAICSALLTALVMAILFWIFG